MSNFAVAWLLVHDIEDSHGFNIKHLAIKTRNYGARIDYTFKDKSILSVYPKTSRAVIRNSKGGHMYDVKLKINKRRIK